MSNRSSKARLPRRAGSLMVIMLLCLLAIMMFGAALTRSIVLHHRQLQRSEWQQQSMWLADSGLQRALHKLSQDSEYHGEIWELSAESLGSDEAGAVTISIDPIAETDGDLTVRVESQYPRDSIHRVIYQRERMMYSNPGGLP